ncbi:hypothetical protein [Burkholderia sp. Ac-20365]|uniref:hypothetical protein n=1 Tax=Burkholderia sp. Ac-20365 TaxID=2703897 RepID=UPI00197C9EC7|nr:hypothetical protein [Burkholderia sp. Ac-20365]MBN3764576.1 hypothetical protein [Burkholderia sp. Ac-20365]
MSATLVWFGLVWFGLVWFGFCRRPRCDVPLHALPLCAAAFALGCLVTLGWFGFVFAGIRDLLLVLHALPLCGAALTFFAAAKKVSKESGLTPPVLDLRLRAPNGSSASHGNFSVIARCQPF